MLQQSIASILLIGIILAQITLGSSNSQREHTPSSWTSNTAPLNLNSGLWFGQRVGRRHKRNSKEVGLYNNDQLSELMQENPWSIFAMNEGKRQMNFTPRLGRDSGEEQTITNSDRWAQAADNGIVPSDVMAQRSPLFAPRLGRRTDVHYGQYA